MKPETIAPASIQYFSLAQLYAASYTHLTLPTNREV